ncbi:peptidoglycan recognition protein [Actinomadura geliboluensis]|uniref:N-acetylmuramoyl-L-alanine amidase n=1 Tax=Actinomadura geliboluensis TaxID=882440 RepID=A0A5S4H4V9_9ACTN|nr:peptidoglycan recognition protein [Actinomadura geliboluensis]TMR40275.1 N-acetylmuramoyl-L-alanine amidase [Actinomadura geliboluensis]
MLKRTIIGASAAAVAVAGTVTWTVTANSTPEPTAATAAAAKGPGAGRVHARGLQDMAGAATARGGKTAGLPAATTEPFSLVGVTWDKPREELRGTVRVRTRDAATGKWSGWQVLEPELADAPDRGQDGRGGTNGLWVGPSNGVEVRVAGQGRTLPEGLRVDLVDPGARTAQSPGAPTPRAAGPDAGTGMKLVAATTPLNAPAAAPVTAPKPAIVARAGWGADESIVRNPPTYDTSVKAVFVHHTDTGNDYTCAESASVIRSVFLYHVKSQGWDDIGYNFLVDKCGTIFEGRAGGVERPVHGAHTYGFNTDTTGIAVLGTHTAANDPTTPGTAPAAAALDGVAKTAAWKLGLTGVDPTAKTILTSAAPDGSGGKYPFGQKVEFNTISGHRDGFATACPGEQLYAKLPAIRTAAKQVTVPALTATVSGAKAAGGRYYTKSTATLNWTPAEGAAYTVSVDGATVAKPAAGASSATVTLAPGTHSVQLHAAFADGTASASPVFTVVADTTRPVVSSMALALRKSTINGTAVPVTLSWKATDNALLSSLKATSPSAKTFSTTTMSWAATSKAGATQSWSLTAGDAAGNTGTAALSRYTGYYNEGAARRTGTWKTTTTKYYLGGRGLYSSSRGASASWTFTGRTAGLIFKRASNLGAVYVYADGVKVATVDTRSSSTLYRQLTWTRSWSTSGKHTIKIVVAGTSGRPTVGIDGLVYLR